MFKFTYPRSICFSTLEAFCNGVVKFDLITKRNLSYSLREKAEKVKIYHRRQNITVNMISAVLLTVWWTRDRQQTKPEEVGHNKANSPHM